MRAKLRAVLYRYEVIKMCGRFVQYQGVADYLKVLGTDRLVVSGYDNHPIARYNVAPSTQVNILYNQQDDLRIDPVRWGWAPLALECCQPTEEFEWYRVSKAVGNIKKQGQDLITHEV